jgi:anti-sigma factor RsiW
MRCDEVRENLVAYLDGEVSPVERERIASHLASCDDCRREKEGLGSTGDLLSTLRSGDGQGPDLAGRVLREARSGEPWCRHIRRELVAHLDGELEDLPSRPVREHLEECEDCAAEARALERTALALETWTVDLPAVDLADRVLRHGTPGGSRGAGRLLALGRLLAPAAAAVLLVAVGLAALLGLFGGEAGTPGAAEEPPIEVLQNLDILDARTLDLLDEDPDLLELAERLDWLESVSEEELNLLTAAGG